MIRRVSAIACGFALAAALCVAVGHDHNLAKTTNAPSTEACMYCAGGMTAAAPVELLPPVEYVVVAEEPQAIEAPALKRTAPLAHSGNAPPA